jgi:hypothetical protein
MRFQFRDIMGFEKISLDRQTSREEVREEKSIKSIIVHFGFCNKP